MSSTGFKELLANSRPDNLKMLMSAFASSYGIGLLALLGIPFMLGATIDSLGLTESEAGFVGTIEFLAIMLASIILAPFINKVPRRTLAFIGLAIAVVGSLLCIQQSNLGYEELVFFRAIAGIGCGMALAVGNATVANSKDPEKMAAHMATLFVALMALTMPLFPWASGLWGFKGVYGALVAVMVALGVFLFALPQSAPSESTDNDKAHKGFSLFALANIFVLVAMFVFALRDISGWAFIERIGLEVGYTGGEIGGLLSLQAVLGISGPVVAAIVGSRFGLKIPLFVGIVSSGLVYFVMLLLPNSMIAYTASALLIGGTYFFALSYLTAFAAELDSQGRVVAASGGFLSAGIAAGPMVGGYLVERFGYEGTSWAILAMAVITLVLVALALRASHLTSAVIATKHRQVAGELS